MSFFSTAFGYFYTSCSILFCQIKQPDTVTSQTESVLLKRRRRMRFAQSWSKAGQLSLAQYWVQGNKLGSEVMSWADRNLNELCFWLKGIDTGCHLKRWLWWFPTYQTLKMDSTENRLISPCNSDFGLMSDRSSLCDPSVLEHFLSR